MKRIITTTALLAILAAGALVTAPAAFANSCSKASTAITAYSEGSSTVSSDEDFQCTGATWHVTLTPMWHNAQGWHQAICTANGGSPCGATKGPFNPGDEFTGTNIWNIKTPATICGHSWRLDALVNFNIGTDIQYIGVSYFLPC